MFANGPKSFDEYKLRPFSSELMGSEEFSPDMVAKLKKAEKTMSLEFLGMCQTGKDITVEYSNADELKRLRLTYITHVLNYVCHDRDRVFKNDMIALEEKHKDRVTLQNVFEIAEAKEEK